MPKQASSHDNSDVPEVGSEPGAGESQEEKELEVLKHISRHEEVHQRDLARVVGMSLGMTNGILKRLSKKGLLTIRKVNNRNIRYAVTPAGMEEIARRSYTYFKRTIKNVVYYKEAVEALIRDIKHREYARVILVGASDLDFIVEHLCWKYELELLHVRGENDDQRGADPAAFRLYAENQPVEHRAAPSGPGWAYLVSVLEGRI
jgi:DNA-binding MarR family transcriptional regulator